MDKVPDKNPEDEDEDDHEAAQDAEAAEAARRAGEALEGAVAEIDTPEEAERSLEALEKSAGEAREEDVARATPDVTSPQEQAAAVEAAGAKPDSEPAEVIEAAAVQSANASPEDKGIVDAAVSQALGGQGQRDGNETAAAATGSSPSPAPALVHGRRLLRKALFRRLRPLQAIDAVLFVEINGLPHTALSDRAMSRLSWVMTGGAGWLLILALAMMQDRRRGWKPALAVVPALWLATATVEYPIKKWFRRRRPFISLVEAIVVGRKPGSYSFPSGHSAAAFAGAWLLARQYPGGARAFFGLAALVGFSRIYLGAHYPGDVASGSILGMALARGYSRVIRALKG